MKKTLLLILLFYYAPTLQAEDGYALWLRYKPVENAAVYRKIITAVQAPEGVIKEELARGLNAMLQTSIPFAGQPTLVVAVQHTASLGPEGFMIKSFRDKIVISANTDIGLLYGVFHFLRLIQ